MFIKIKTLHRWPEFETQANVFPSVSALARKTFILKTVMYIYGLAAILINMTITKKIYRKAFWTSIIILSGYYLYRAILFRFYKEGIGETFWDKQFFFIFHLLTAILPLTLGPLQFWNWFRNRWTNLHRLLGKIYIVGSLLGGVSAFVLGVLQPYEGSIVPVVILSLLWLFMTIAAWVAIRNKNIKGHRLFMIRSYMLALTFVWLRVLSDLVYKHNLLSFIKNEEIRDTTYEWMSWVLPILIVELSISWIPLLKHKNNIRSASVGVPAKDNT